MGEPKTSRRALIKNVFIFQVKLSIDAMRDLLLSPVSIVCAIADLIKGSSSSESYFQKLMALGHKTDAWLNLFGNHDSGAVDITDKHNKEKVNINVDHIFSQVESLIKEQHDKGGLTASARSTIDSYLNKLAEIKNSSETTSAK